MRAASFPAMPSVCFSLSNYCCRSSVLDVGTYVQLAERAPFALVRRFDAVFRVFHTQIRVPLGNDEHRGVLGRHRRQILCRRKVGKDRHGLADRSLGVPKVIALDSSALQVCVT